MSKLMPIAAAGLVMIAASLPAHADPGSTTRIEPRPFYGATVTIEAGVRVFRPLPPTKRVIINPNGSTPVSLGFNETRVYKKSRSYNYHQHDYYGEPNYGYSGGSSFPSGPIGSDQ